MGSYHLQLVAPDDPIGIIYWIIPIDNSKPVVIQIVLDKLNGSQTNQLAGILYLNQREAASGMALIKTLANIRAHSSKFWTISTGV